MGTVSDRPVIVIGLGNPGFEYEDTRHNVGFMVVDQVSVRRRAEWHRDHESFLSAQTAMEGRTLLLVKPQTYMNNSGVAVADVLKQHAVPLENLIVVVDDFWLDLGTIRVRAKGGDGGHNGLRSIIEHLGTDEFARIRCGIRSAVMPPKHEMAEFVLSPFEPEEREKAERMIDTAADAIEEFVRSGIERTMNIYNTVA